MRSLWTVWDDSTERRGAVDASSGWNAVTHDVEAREDWMSQQSLFRRQEKWRGWGLVLRHVGAVSWPWEKFYYYPWSVFVF